MTENRALTHRRLRTPKAAALAGILFSLLATMAFWLLWITVPADPQEPGAWLQNSSVALTLALNLIPFAGIAFLWFIAVLRDRLGQDEDRFFATVFFGSGLLFLCMLLTAAAVVGAILAAFVVVPQQIINSGAYYVARAIAYNVLNIYMIKMASVFMITTSTLAIYTNLVPKWLAILGYGLSLLLLFGSYYIRWSFLVFPLWVFLLSLSIAIDNLRQPSLSE